MKIIDNTSTLDRKILNLQKFGFRNAFVLGRYNYKSTKESLPPHTHDNKLEICFLEKGEQVYNVNENNYSLKGGDIFITFPNELHGTGGYPEFKGVLYWFILKIPDIPEPILNLPPNESQALTHELLSIKQRHFQANHKIKLLLENIYRVYSRDSYRLQKIEISNLLISYLLEIIKLAKNAEPHIISTEIELIKKLISENIQQPFVLGDLAGKINLSLSRFKSRFKKEVGIPPGEYIQMQKIELSKQLLIINDNSITEIAYKLNFSSSQYFATVFKRFVGCSPMAYKIKTC